MTQSQTKEKASSKALAKKSAGASYITGILGEKCVQAITPFGPVDIRPVDVTIVRDIHTYSMPGRAGVNVNHDGYELLAAATGVSIVTPHSFPNGELNPHIIKDDNGVVVAVKVWKFAVGFLPTGDMSIQSRSIEFNIESYFRTSAISKIKKSKTVGGLISRRGFDKLHSDDEMMVYIETNKAHAFGFYLDLSKDECMSLLQEQEQLRQFAERRALTIGERVVLDHHPAVAQPDLKDEMGDGKKIIRRVYSVRHRSPEFLNAITKLTMGQDPQIKGFDYQAAVVDSQSPTDISAMVAEEDAAEVATNGEPAAPEPSEADLEHHRKNLIEQIRTIKDALPKETWGPIEQELASLHGFKNFNEADVEALTEYLARLGKVLDDAGEQGAEKE